MAARSFTFTSSSGCCCWGKLDGRLPLESFLADGDGNDCEGRVEVFDLGCVDFGDGVRSLLFFPPFLRAAAAPPGDGVLSLIPDTCGGADSFLLSLLLLFMPLPFLAVDFAG